MPATPSETGELHPPKLRVDGKLPPASGAGSWPLSCRSVSVAWVLRGCDEARAADDTTERLLARGDSAERLLHPFGHLLKLAEDDRGSLAGGSMAGPPGNIERGACCTANAANETGPHDEFGGL